MRRWTARDPRICRPALNASGTAAALRLPYGIWRFISGHALTRFASRGTAVPQMRS
jgi:hypothetical protein